jgi:hypothetical protein
VRVAGTICVRVVYAVRHGPLNWSTLECDRAARHKKICNGFWNFISAMRQQPVKSHADAKTAANPVKYQRRDHSRPAPEKAATAATCAKIIKIPFAQLTPRVSLATRPSVRTSDFIHNPLNKQIRQCSPL